MHTTALMDASDFAYRRGRAGADAPTDFAALFPDFHPLDRVGVVSPHLEDGVLFAGASLLALTTAFYDSLRTRGGAFFDYPRHFALIGGDGDRVRTRTGTAPCTEPLLRATWGNLDVWPATNWFVVPPTASAMLGRIHALQIDRLFWPEALAADAGGPRLPALARRLLRSRLKSVHLYGAEAPDAWVCASPRAFAVLARSRAALPGDVPPPAPDDADALRGIGVNAFLATMGPCFEDESPAVAPAP